MENLLNVKAKDFEKYINLDRYELVENEDNSFIKTIILVNTENNALTAEIDEFVVYLIIIWIVVGLTIDSLFVGYMESLPNYTKPHRYIVQDNDDDL